MIVDAHQHFWDPTLADYPWMTEEVASLRRRFGPDDLEPLLRQHGVIGTVLVQARGSADETQSLVTIARSTPFVLGVVGWVDLTARDVPRELAALEPAVVGVRHQVHDEPDPRWLAREDVQRGLEQVARAGLVYDLLVRTRELAAAADAARRNPGLRLVLDHVGKPPLVTGRLEEWAAGVQSLARLPNVSCKLSGLVTEAEWNAWRRDEIVSCLRQALEWFGSARCMFGSDWPVCSLAAEYGEVLELVEATLAGASASERDAVLGGTAVAVYGLSTNASSST